MTLQAPVSDALSHEHQVRQTRQALDTIDDTSLVHLTQLGVDTVRAIKQEVAEIFPASNLPALLLQGLIQLEDRTIRDDRIAADLTVLFRGSKQIGLYSTFFAAPALVLYGYQRLLALAGKDADSAFPDGPWQFYTQFGLREDAARHCVETVGFTRAAPQASELDAATCWVYAAIRALFAYDDLLANEWQERMTPRALDDVLAERATQLLGKRLPRKNIEREALIAGEVAQLRQVYQLDRLAANWVHQRPYASPPDDPLGDYVAYRRQRYHSYLDQALRALPPDLRAMLERRVEERRARDLPAYQRQLTLLTTLHAETYQDRREALPMDQACVALLVGGRYHLIEAIARDPRGRLLVFPIDGTPDSPGIALALNQSSTGERFDRYNRLVTIDRRGGVWADDDLLGRLRPPPIAHVKGQVDAILRSARPARTPGKPEVDLLLARAPRERQGALRALLNESTRDSLVTLRRAPIAINWAMHSSTQPLTALRRARRGCGDHALTLIRSDCGMAFDLSHIFFDAVWGMALAEILTSYATSLYSLVVATRTTRAAAAPIILSTTAAFVTAAQEAIAGTPAEVSTETSAVDLRAINLLRQRLGKIELRLTINDLLILARCAHAVDYQPSPAAGAALDSISALAGGAQLARRIRAQLDEQRSINPALLIPMDASNADPRMRVFPATFRNPLPQLLPRLSHCRTLVDELRRRPDERLRHEFEHERALLYADLRMFGAILQAFKQVTMRGESFTTASLRLMGHLPGLMQNLVDLIPQKIGILNEIIKGHEVFSNVGQVVATSTLTRFASARDDGTTKQLVWGIMSDASGLLYITLRDFRPHIGPLLQGGRADLAHALAQDYLDSYAATTNTLVRSIQRVLAYK